MLFAPLYRYFLFLIAVLGPLAVNSAYGIPWNPGPPPQATLRGNGAVVIKPGEQITLKVQHQDGKITGLTKLAWDAADARDIIRISLKREGGTATKLGPISPITDILSLGITIEKPLSARCEYITLNSQKPERTRLSGKLGVLKKSFRWGVSQITITEIQFTKHGEQ